MASHYLIALVISGLLVGCSLDSIPIHSSRIKSAKSANQAVQRGPNAPGAFTKTWKFATASGFLFDPSRIAIRDGSARLVSLKPGEKAFSSEKAVLQISTGAPYAALDGFSEITGPGHQGVTKYQLSTDGSQWFYFNGSRWVSAALSAEQSNTATEVGNHITTFDADVGQGSLFVRVFLLSPSGTEPVELQSIKVQGIAPKTDGWD